MNIMELGAIGELVGGVAVIASLIYVGLQVKQSNKFAAAETVRSFLHEYNAVMRRGGEHELCSLMRKAMTNFDDLNNDEKSEAHNQILTHVMLVQTAFMLMKRGFSDPDIMNIVVGFNALVLNMDGLHEWWGMVKKVLDPEFVAFMDAERIKYPRLSDVIPFYVPSETN